MRVLKNRGYGWAGGGEYGGHFHARERQEAGHDTGIELRTARLKQPPLGLFEGQPTAVRARRNHGIERVDDGDDAGTNWNLLALQSAWITFSIKALMVV